MIRKRGMGVAIVVAVGLAFGGTAAWAGTTYSTYSTTVASVGGYGYTAYQTKATSGAAANLQSSNVGGSYQVSARTNSPYNVGTWTGYVVDDGTNHNLQNPTASGSNIRAQFKNRPQTVVSVQVDGRWRSN